MSPRITTVVAALVTLGVALAIALGDLQPRHMVFSAMRSLFKSPSQASGQAQANSYQDTFVTSLRDAGGKRFVRVALVIEFDDGADRQEVQRQSTRLHEAMLLRVADCSGAELTGSEGVARGKQLVLEAMKSTSPLVTPRAVYFNEFFVE